MSTMAACAGSTHRFCTPSFVLVAKHGQSAHIRSSHLVQRDAHPFIASGQESQSSEQITCRRHRDGTVTCAPFLNHSLDCGPPLPIR